ncbi:MAG: dTDP-4-dehydrorhamnose 3,5-epimerase [Pseudomonadota bacterium]
MSEHLQFLAVRDVVLLKANRFGDSRGWFCETWNSERMKAAGIDLAFVQDNHSYSAAENTLRGLHFQAPPHAQDKLVRCSRGAILDVAVDIRRGAPTYGQWVSEELSAENGKQLLIPKGFLHGFLTLQADTEVQYKCSDYYARECEGTVRWDSVGIDWRMSGSPILSPKDADAPPFSDFVSPFIYEEMR